jgi:hypothetical protein
MHTGKWSPGSAVETMYYKPEYLYHTLLDDEQNASAASISSSLMAEDQMLPAASVSHIQ